MFSIRRLNIQWAMFFEMGHLLLEWPIPVLARAHSDVSVLVLSNATTSPGA